MADSWPVGSTAWLFGIEFLLVSLTWLVLQRQVVMPGFRGDLLGAISNATLFFCLLAAGLGGADYHGLVVICGVALAFAVYHAIIGAVVLRQTDLPRLRFVYLMLALSFLTIALPLQLRTSALTLAWAAESGILIWAGINYADRRLRWFGLALLAVTAIKVLIFDIFAMPTPFRFLLNYRMLSGAAVIIAAYLSAWLLWRKRDRLSPGETGLATLLVSVANLYTLLFVSLDLWDGFRQTTLAGSRNAQQLALSIFWSIYALILLVVGIWKQARPVRIFAMALLYIAILKVFILDLSYLDTPYRIISFLGLGVILLVVSLLYTRFEGRRNQIGQNPEHSVNSNAGSPPAQ